MICKVLMLLLGIFSSARSAPVGEQGEGVQEFVDTVPLALGFASAYAEVQQEKNQEVMNTFIATFLCEFSCKNENKVEERTKCEENFCSKSDQQEQVEEGQL